MIAVQAGPGATPRQINPTREIARFLAATLVLGVALQALAVRLGLHDGGMVCLTLTMWAPAAGALASGPVGRALSFRALRQLGTRHLPIALALGFAPRLLQTLVLALTGWGAWDAAHFELASDGQSVKAIHGLGMALGAGPQSFTFFAANLVLSTTLGAVVVALVGGVGEEIGWRGFLQPALERRLGRLWGTVCVGAIWAYWHLPANLAGYNDPEHPVWNALLLFPIAVIAMSFGLAWLRARSGSVWPAALAHGANNTLGSAFLVGTPVWSTNALLEVTSMALVAALFVRSAARGASDSSFSGADSPTASSQL